jgi:Zn-dependent M28 family amino/carboxypeptidase
VLVNGFVHSPTVRRKSIVADINIDAAPGMRYPCKDFVGSEHSTLCKNVEVAAKQVGYEISPDPSPEENFFVRSDQYSFVQQGIPSVWLRNGADVVKKWLVTRYHTPLDNMEQQISYDVGLKAPTHQDFKKPYSFA